MLKVLSFEELFIRRDRVRKSFNPYFTLYYCYIFDLLFNTMKKSGTNNLETFFDSVQIPT